MLSQHFCKSNVLNYLYQLMDNTKSEIVKLLNFFKIISLFPPDFRIDLLNPCGKVEIQIGYIPRAMGTQADDNLVVDIWPIGMVIQLFSFQGYGCHKSKGFYKIFEGEFLVDAFVPKLPGRELQLKLLFNVGDYMRFHKAFGLKIELITSYFWILWMYFTYLSSIE